MISRQFERNPSLSGASKAFAILFRVVLTISLVIGACQLCCSDSAHRGGASSAVVNADRPQTARLLFDYQDVNNYKSAGLRSDAGQQKWVLKVVQDGVESDLVAPVPDPTLQPDHWYQLDLVVELNKVTLYADGQEKISWQRGSSGPRLTGGRVGVATRGGSAAFQELEQWDVGHVTKYYAVGGQRVALRRTVCYTTCTPTTWGVRAC